MAAQSDPRPAGWLRCFGVGEGWPSSDRRHSSYHYRLGSTRLLVDCGDGLSQGYQASGLGPEEVDHLWISHMHSDHVGGFSLFIQGLWLGRRRKPLHVHAPGGAIPALQAWLEATLLPAGLLGFPIEWHPIQPGVPVECRHATVTAFPTTHLDGLRRRFSAAHPAICFEAYSFLIESRSLRIGHTADIGHVRDLEPLLEKPLDLLVSELSHVAPPELFERLKPCAIGQIVWVHLSSRWWNDKAETRRSIQSALGTRRSRIANDGDLLPILVQREGKTRISRTHTD